LLAVTFAAGCNGGLPGQPSGPPSTGTTEDKPVTPPVVTTDVVSVKVYFAMKSAQLLAAEVHPLKKDAQLLQKTLELLVAGPKTPGLMPVIPADTKIRSVVVKDRVAMADFSRELVNKAYGGSTDEILAVAAIVNTLTEFADVEKVQILVDGKKVTTLAGHMDVSEPLGRSPDIIRRQ